MAEIITKASEDAVGDSEAVQIWLYHPDYPDGHTFWTDDLPPEEDGWVDSKTKLPGYQQPAKPKTVNMAEKREAPHQLWMYHGDERGKVFWSNEVPTTDEGWFDNQAEADEWWKVNKPDAQPAEPEPEKKPAATLPPAETVKVAPKPADFESVDAFMHAWVEVYVADEMPAAAKRSEEKKGIETYAKAKFDVDLNRTWGVPRLRDAVIELEKQQAAE